ncbi:hypothetical protein CAQU_02010 [Corynebacterium aquilae DSM 44791]|uniref:Uncharacterized protein n=2 Tax=Corynebacterium aquilae TaxID=203263 RepID=A0A1L7CDX8_9CORY|nr:hypothetical protein CAQU_02010 [Corynebacterium aquilae DSM 44791]
MSPSINPTLWVVPFVPGGIGTWGEDQLPGPTRAALTQLSAGRGDAADVAADPALREAGLALYHYGPHGRLEPVVGNQALLDADTFATFVIRDPDTTNAQPPTHTWPITLPTTPHPAGEEQHLHYSDCGCTTCAPAPGRHPAECTCPACEQARVCGWHPVGYACGACEDWYHGLTWV